MARDSGDSIVGESAGHGPAAAICRVGFNAVLDGRRMSLEELGAATGASLNALSRLVGRARMLDEHARVVAVHGLSLAPARQHRLTLRGRRFWTWCAIDAAGIPAGIREDATVETTCHQCGVDVRLELRAGEVVASSHPEACIWEAARRGGRGTAGPPHCALMNLFCCPEHLAAWRDAHPAERGIERTLADVGELGRAEWEYVMEGSAPADCCEHSCD